MEKVTSKLIELLKDCETRVFEGKNKRIRIIPGTSLKKSAENMISEFKTELEEKKIPYYISEESSPRCEGDYEINLNILELVY